ncbi:MAG: DNA cytosine methyltransferase [Gammaproteobacteria bacterium]|nr:DNA cytosine methyltransferase [Gammaproteobacteria bacterium]
MRKPVPVVDLFSGPGGLAEGFAAVQTKGGKSRYRIELSIEMDEVAHRTLRLRAFLRKFRAFPDEYYEYVNGLLPSEPDWATLYPEEWEESGNETPRVELGTAEATKLLKKRIGAIRREHGSRTVLLGGPPCQSYSVAGRARNAGNPNYDIKEDERLSLYKEYAIILGKLQPWVAVMENVKGMLSAQYEDKPVFDDVMEALQNAGGRNRYRLLALAPATESRSWKDGLEPKDFLVRAEEHGVPQRRHRVFVICIRADVASALPERMFPKLKPREERVALSDVVGEMPQLRSRLSRGDDGEAWQSAVEDAFNLVGQHLPETSQTKERKFRSALKLALKSASGEPLPFRDLSTTDAAGVADSCPESLREWFFDENLTRLPNNETRGHICEDIGRYLYAAAFARTFGRSPRAEDFPSELAPEHANWKSGKFADRFRVQLADKPSRLGLDPGEGWGSTGRQPVRTALSPCSAPSAIRSRISSSPATANPRSESFRR